MGRGGGGGGRGGGGGGGGLPSLEQQLAGNREAEARSRAINNASTAQIEAAVSNGTITPIEAAASLIRRTSETNTQDLRRGDIVSLTTGPLEVSSVTSTGRIRGRRLTATGATSQRLETTRFGASSYSRFDSPETARAFVRNLNQSLTSRGL